MRTSGNCSKIDKEVVDRFFHAREVGSKYCEAFPLGKLVEDKKSFFEPFIRARLLTENEKKESF